VFNIVITIGFPRNDPNASIKPAGTPTRPARRVDAQLTLSDTATMDTISVSSDITKRIAEIKLSNRRSIDSPKGE
jgi:hypothetical protein